jgi:excinuclease ABC subunit B
VRPSQGQVDDLVEEIQVRIEHGERTLVTTLTKRMAEELSDYLKKLDIRTAYMHSDVETMERIEIIDNLRAGAIDVLVGVNLLREGLDLPEVSLVAILDADKEGFLRSRRSLTQTAGRAARNLNGTVIMYADNITDSMRQTIDETERRRTLQLKYNEDHGITPTAIIKARTAIIGQDTDMRHPTAPSRHNQSPMPAASSPKLRYTEEFDASAGVAADPVVAYMSGKDMQAAIDRLKTQMIEAAKRMDFLEAAQYRDEILKLEELLEEKNID